VLSYKLRSLWMKRQNDLAQNWMQAFLPHATAGLSTAAVSIGKTHLQSCWVPAGVIGNFIPKIEMRLFALFCAIRTYGNKETQLIQLHIQGRSPGSSEAAQ